MGSANTSEQSGDTQRLFGIRRSAVLEIIGFFVVAVLVDSVLMDGTRFRDVNPHPFWLFLLVIAAHYGTEAGVFTAVLATVLSLAGNLPARDPLMNQSVYLLHILGQPVLWFGSAVIMGELRTHQERQKNTLQMSVEALETQTDALTDSNKALQSSNERLQTAAAGQVETALSLLQAARSLEKQNASSVLFSVNELITTLLAPTAYSIYLDDGEQLILEVRTSDGQCAEALQSYHKDSALYQSVIVRQEFVHIATPVGQQVLGDDGILAGPLLDIETGTSLGMLKIEALPFANLRLGTVHTFRLICEWIGSAYRNAQVFEEANKSRVVHHQSQLLTDAYYQQVSTFLVAVAERARFEVTQLTVRFQVQETSLGQDRLAVSKIMRDAVTAGLRTTDLAFDYQEERGEYIVLLPMTSTTHGQLVADRLRERIVSQFADTAQMQVSITFEALYTPTEEDLKPWHKTRSITGDNSETSDKAKATGNIKTTDNLKTTEPYWAEDKIETNDNLKTTDPYWAEDKIETSDNTKTNDSTKTTGPVWAEDKIETSDNTKTNDSTKTTGPVWAEDKTKTNDSTKTSTKFKITKPY